MNEKFDSNNNEKTEFNPNVEDSDYDSLITRLLEIRATIALVEKHYLEKF